MRLIKTRLPVLARVHEEELLVRGHRPQVRRARGLDVVDDLAHVHHRLEAKHAAELRPVSNTHLTLPTILRV